VEEAVMLNNPKTTITGYLTLAASLLMVVAHGLSGMLSVADLTALIGAICGVGLISAKDGGH
jgi:type IV secretory pathway VirB2 component (pilin)